VEREGIILATYEESSEESMRLKKSKAGAEEELVSLINEGYKLLDWILSDYQTKTKNDKISRWIEIDKLYKGKVNLWIDKVKTTLESIFPTSMETYSFNPASFPPLESISAERKLQYSYQYLRLEECLKTLKEILKVDLVRYSDLPLSTRLYVEDIDSFRNVRDVNPDMGSHNESCVLVLSRKAWKPDLTDFNACSPHAVTQNSLWRHFSH